MNKKNNNKSEKINLHHNDAIKNVEKTHEVVLSKGSHKIDDNVNNNFNNNDSQIHSLNMGNYKRLKHNQNVNVIQQSRPDKNKQKSPITNSYSISSP
jgi:hypothetical protein